MNNFKTFVAVLLVVGCFCSIFFCFFGLGVSWEREHASKKATTNIATCSRCGKNSDKGLMQTYSLDGKQDILFCRKCVYDQADSFMKFCPVEE